VLDSPLKFAKKYFSRRDPLVLEALRRSTVGIAGAGGLGSNVALSLARAGVGRLIIADDDRIEPSNLNRQQFFVDQVGRPKVEALRENLLRANPYSVYEIHKVRITRHNAAQIFEPVDVLVEAFDRAAAKEMLIEASLARFPGRPIVAASGLAGFGRNRKLHTRKLGNLYICGDEESQSPKGISPMAPRVALVAAMQANLVVELLVRLKGRRPSGKGAE
jgi:sulfur carrier protein ThiS adenylyltransferase